MESEPTPAARWANANLLRNAVVFMAVVLAGFVIKTLQEVITPLVVAVFMLLLIDAFSVGLQRRWPKFPARPPWTRARQIPLPCCAKSMTSQ